MCNVKETPTYNRIFFYFHVDTKKKGPDKKVNAQLIYKWCIYHFRLKVDYKHH